MFEGKFTKQIAGDPRRRWISDDYFDLIVWYETDGALHGFQLCYDKERHERVLMWIPDKGFTHAGIDPGDTSVFSNATPVFAAGGEFPGEEVRRELIARGKSLPQEIMDFLLGKIAEYQKKSSV